MSSPLPSTAAAAADVSAPPAAWDTMYDKLIQFHQKHGHCRIPYQNQNLRKLYKWVSYQRRNAALTEQQRARLDAVDYDWAIPDQYQESRWNKLFERLEAYKDKHGDCLVPAGYEDQQLAEWARKQRYGYRLDKRSDERMRRLESIGFAWGPVASSVGGEGGGRKRGSLPATPAGGQRCWDAMYQKLSRYYRTNGKCYVSKLANANLNNWILEQRVAYANNELSADKRRKLDQIHFAWMSRGEMEEVAWNKMFESLIAYQTVNGDCLVPRSYCEDRKLYIWVKNQRTVNKKGKLVWHRRDRLRGIGFCWDGNPKPKQSLSLAVPETQPNPSAGGRTSVTLPSSNGQLPRWNLQFERLKIYQAWYGDCLVPTSYDKELAEWVSCQHHLNTINKLREPRYGKLERIGFFSDAEAEKSLKGGTKRGASTRDPLEREDQSFAGARYLPDWTNNLDNGVRLPKRTRVDGFTPSKAGLDSD